MFDEQDARDLLKTLKVPPEVMQHSEAVYDTCMDLIELIRESNRVLKVNKRLVGVGALLHDIGRLQANGIEHGIVGAQMLRDLNVRNDLDIEKVALICERHIGGGIPKEEAAKLGLPPKDYLPRSLEEKIVAYCDNMVDDTPSGPVVHDPAWAAIDYAKKHGKNSEPAKRVRELNRFFENLLTR